MPTGVKLEVREMPLRYMMEMPRQQIINQQVEEVEPQMATEL